MDPTTALPVSPIVATAPGVAPPSGSTISVQFPSLDPAITSVHQRSNIKIAAAATTKIITGMAGKNTYILFLKIFTATANNIALVEGATSCSTPLFLDGGGAATAATGDNFAANQGVIEGTGLSAIAGTTTTGDDVCLMTSSAGPVSGRVVWVQQ